MGIKGLMVTAALVAMMSSANASDPIKLTMGHALPYKNPESFRTIIIGNPAVLDVVAQSTKSLIFQPLVTGSSNVLFLDGDNHVLNSIDVIVTDAGAARVKIHNKQLVNSFTSYRCWSEGCEYVDETTVKEPPPPPPAPRVQNNVIVGGVPDNGGFQSGGPSFAVPPRR